MAASQPKGKKRALSKTAPRGKVKQSLKKDRVVARTSPRRVSFLRETVASRSQPPVVRAAPPRASMETSLVHTGPQTTLAIQDGMAALSTHSPHPIQALAIASTAQPPPRPALASPPSHPVAAVLRPAAAAKPVWVEADCEKNLCPNGDCTHLTKNYKKWALILHPDRNQGSLKAKEDFQNMVDCQTRLQKGTAPRVQAQAHALQAAPNPTMPTIVAPHFTEAMAHSFPWPLFEGTHASQERESPPRRCRDQAQVLLQLWDELTAHYAAERHSAACGAAESARADQVLQKVNEYMRSNL